MSRVHSRSIGNRQGSTGTSPLILAGIGILGLVVVTCAGLIAVPLWIAFMGGR